ncbi:hypothetical protein [Helicobacter pylori]|uniref:hypothetical protein n=1 Tax=Helicobacter pylori TaxID=210 RepID=UPI0009A2B9BF|nr:hypothetical protein [Helicobacter pylori]NHA48572.1 hypothetical protein [Helicobacter pylori]OPG24797.1 hypothetical protein BGL58_04840 [Helicobacter pylori]OPG24811.1 hypothetical protein BGL58_04915 [Helicobacter pylori]
MCEAKKVSNRKLVSDTTEVMEATLNCMLWVSDLKLFTTCVRQNVKDPKLADIAIEGVKNEMKEQLDDL